MGSLWDHFGACRILFTLIILQNNLTFLDLFQLLFSYFPLHAFFFANEKKNVTFHAHSRGPAKKYIPVKRPAYAGCDVWAEQEEAQGWRGPKDRPRLRPFSAPALVYRSDFLFASNFFFACGCPPPVFMYHRGIAPQQCTTTDFFAQRRA